MKVNTKFKRSMTALLSAAIVMSSATVPAMASGVGSSDVTLVVETGEEPSIVNIKVPTEIPLNMSKEGIVSVPQDLKISNLSEDTDIVLSQLSVTGKNGWTVKDFSEDLASKPEGTKELSMSFRGDGTNGVGNVTLTDGQWNINRSSDLQLNVSAKLPKQTFGYEQKGSIAQVNYVFAVNDENDENDSQATITNNWNKDKVIKESVTPVVISYESDDPSAYIASVESNNPNISIEKSEISGFASGSETWNVTANEIGTANVTATLNTGETTSFDVNVYALNLPDTGEEGGSGNIEVDVPDKKPGDSIETGDITIDIPITNPDGSDGTITVTPEIPEGTPPLVEGENNINVNINIDININININITVNVNDGSQEPSEQFTVTYITDGNGTVSENSRTFNDGDALTFPSTTANNGYVFDKWIETTGDTEVTTSTSVTSNMEVKAVFVEKVILESIEVTKQPTKTEYTEGESFDSTGLEITAQYSDGGSNVVNGWTVIDGDNLNTDKNTVTIQYIEDGITKECTVSITVNEAEAEVIEIELNQSSYSLLIPEGTTELDLSQVIHASDGKDYLIIGLGTRALTGNTTLESLVISPNIEYISDYAFANCDNLSSVEIIDGANPTFGKGIFKNDASITEINIPDSITTLGVDMFSNCTGLTNLTLSQNINSIPESCFYYCESLENIIIPNNVKTIGKWAFHHCTSVSSISIPKSVTSIGENAFYSVPHIYYSGSASGRPWGALAIN